MPRVLCRPLRGVLRLPPKEAGGDGGDHYHQKVKHPISFAEIRTKVERNLYKKGTELQLFKADVEQVFNNAVRWHSARWIPDTDDDTLDPNDCPTEADIEAAGAKPFVTSAEHGAFTLPQIFEKEKIPKEFMKNTLKQNKDIPGFKDLGSQFNWGTSLLMPHRQDVAAVNMAHVLKAKAIESIDGIGQEMADAAAHLKQLKRADLDNKVECAMCKKWRIVNAQQHRQFGGEGVEFRCVDAGRQCEEKCDDAAGLDNDDISVKLKTAGQGGGGGGGAKSRAGTRGWNSSATLTAQKSPKGKGAAQAASRDPRRRPPIP